jgi:hypothetical protein
MHKERNFHEGNSTVGEWLGSGRGRARERHGMYESALRISVDLLNQLHRF